LKWRKERESGVSSETNGSKIFNMAMKSSKVAVTKGVKERRKEGLV